jgi:SAM-dependent methyltransferase
MVASCPTCHGRSHRKLPTPGRWIGREVFAAHGDALGLSRCTGCGLVFVSPRPIEKILEAFYGGQTYECHRPDDTEGLREKASVVLERVQRHVPRARRFLDYGCGGGFLLRAARARGLAAVGLDIGAEARRVCRAQGFTVAADPSELERGAFDVIVMHHVFEHMPDPRRALSELAPLLSDTGRLLIEVPNVASLRARLSAPWLCRRFRFDERHRAFPIHLWYFEPRTLRLLLSRSGFEVTALETYGVGLDELILRPGAGATPGVGAATDAGATTDAGPGEPGRSRIRNLLPAAIRRTIKRRLFDRALGENLLAVCAAVRPPAPAGTRSAA